MARVEKIVEQMRNNPRGVRFVEFAQVCRHYFGEPRRTGGSHWVFRVPWAGGPRVNIQDDQGTAKAYQVREVLKAIDKLEAQDG